MPVAGSAPLTVEVESDIIFPLALNPSSPATSYKLRVNFGDTSLKIGGSTVEQSCGVVTTDTDLFKVTQGQCKLNTTHTYANAYPPPSWPGSSPPLLPGYPASVQLLSVQTTSVNPVYTTVKTVRTLWKGPIIVTSGIQADSGASLQLASALTALEEALKGILQYLTQ